MHDELVTILKTFRPLQGRLTGGFQFAPFHEQEQHDPVVNHKLAGIARRLEKEMETGTTSVLLKDKALLLLAGIPNRLDALNGARDFLEQAVVQAPRDGKLLSDLAAVYLDLGKYFPASYLQALSRADAALKIDRTLPEAYYNRALALECLMLDQQAKIAWKIYLRSESQPAWRNDALRRLRHLGSPGSTREWKRQVEVLELEVSQKDRQAVAETVIAFVQPARLYAEEQLLRMWAEAVARDKRRSALHLLTTASYVGAALAAHNGDRMLYDSVAAIKHATSSPTDWRALVLGHQEFGKGLDEYAKRDTTAAEWHFAKAHEAFLKARSPFDLWAKFYLAACSYFRPDYDAAISMFETIKQDIFSQGSHYQSLLGKTYWSLGVVYSVKGDFGTSQRYYLAARSAFFKLGEVENMAVMDLLIGENLEDFGQREAAWHHRYRALKARGSLHNPRWLHNVLFDMAEVALREGLPAVALYFQNEMVALAEARADPVSATEAILRRSRTYRRLGRPREAARDLEKARVWSESILAQGVRKRAQADVMRFEAEHFQSNNPQLALKRLDEALKFYRSADFYSQRLEVLRQRAHIHLALGAFREYQRDLDIALNEIERERIEIPSGRMREAYHELVNGIYDALIAFQLRYLKSPEGAIAISERARARSLLDSLAREGGSRTPRRPGDVLSIDEIRNSLSASVTLVYYLVLEDEICIAVVGRQDVHAVQIPTTRVDLEHLIVALRTTTDDVPFQHTLRQLHILLIEPIKQWLKGGQTLVIVPDEMLYSVPFVALHDGSKYMIEQYCITISPSASVFLALGDNRVRREGLSLKAAIVANPRFDPELFPELLSLAGAEPEAREIGSLYKVHHIVVGRQATKKNFLALVTSHEVIHFAGHAISNARDPDLSMLVLAPDQTSGETGVLFMREIYDLNLHHTRLVVLAGCRTAAGPITAGEGPVSFSRAFLSRGVRSVVGSLWEVDDRLTRPLMLSFHARISRGEGVAIALQKAQLELLKNKGVSSSPRVWGAFEVVGNDQNI